MDNDSVTLVVSEEDELQASKERLCAVSPYFQAMFHGGFAEEHTSHVKIKGVTKVALSALLNHANNLKMDLNSDNVYQILQAAGMLQFADAQRECCDFIVAILNLDNAGKVLNQADFLCEEGLFNKAFHYVLYEFTQFRLTSGFLQLTFRLVLLLLCDDNLNVTAEMDVFEAAKAWLQHEPETRMPHATELYSKCVRFALLANTAKEVAMKEHNFDGNKEPKKRAVPQYPCCIGRYKKSPWVFLFNPTQAKVEPFLSLSDKATSSGITASGFQVGSTGTRLYVFGGEFTLGRSNWNTQVRKYDTMTESWSEPLALESPRRHHTLAVNGTEIFVIGGFGKHRVLLDSVVVYDETGNALRSCQSMPQPMYSVASFCHKGLLYVIKDNLNKYAYDGEKDRWDRAFAHVTLPKGLEFNAIMPFKDSAYMTSKFNYKLFKFPLPTDDAEETQKDPIEASLVGEFQQETQNVCLVDNVIYNFSSDQFDYYSTVEAYDIETGEFKLVYKTEDEELDFSPYFSFGCFPLTYYQNTITSRLLATDAQSKE